MDGLKFILIALVIFGHCKHFTPYDRTLLSTKLVSYAIHSVYLFHMPLFIMVSGYFSKKSEKDRFVWSLLKLLKVFLLFHLLWIGIDALRGESLSIAKFICPSFTLWYLLSLAYWRCFLQCIPDKYDNPRIVLPLSAFLSLIGGLIPLTNEFSIPRTLTFMPIFFLGYYTRKFNWMEVGKKLNPFWLLVLVLVIIFVENKINLDIYGRRPYTELMDVIKRVSFLSSSVIISLTFVRMLPQKISVFSGEGKDVLFYYVYHSFVLCTIAEFLWFNGITVGGVGLMLIVLSTMMILYIGRRIQWLHVPLR